MHYDRCTTTYNQLVDAWRMFCDMGTTIQEIPGHGAYTSWIRCNHRDIYGASEQNIKTNKIKVDTSSLVANSKQIINQIDSILNKIFGGNYAVILMNEEGVIIDVVYSSREAVAFVKHYSETNATANAIDIISHEKKVVEICGYDHLYPGAEDWHTVAALIHNFDRTVAGGLGIVIQTNWMPSLVPIVKIGAGFIQSHLILEQIAKYKISHLLEEISSPVIVVNQQGVILNANQKFQDLLDISLNPLTGQDFRDFVIDELDFNALFSFVGEFETNIPVSIRGRRNRVHSMKMSKCIIGNYDKQPLILLSFTPPLIKEVSIVHSNHTIGDQLYTFNDLIGASECFMEVKTMAHKAAKSFFSVLIEGESGTGKELMAQSIHKASRPQGPFVAINCGAFTKELLQSELFGYEEGAFTGAKKGGKPGKFELADGGSLFLDEIGEMSMEMQVSLLRCLQEKKVTRVGGTLTKKVDVRIITATNRNLYEEVQKGNFREDLYYRVNVIQLTMPPLRERKEDIPLLSNYFLSKLCRDLKLNQHIQISVEAMACLCRYNWPGNIRELNNVIERAIVYLNGTEITKDCLPSYLKKSVVKTSEETNGSLQEYEKIAIMKAITNNEGNISKSAEELGIARSTLYQKMDKLGIEH